MVLLRHICQNNLRGGNRYGDFSGTFSCQVKNYQNLCKVGYLFILTQSGSNLTCMTTEWLINFLGGWLGVDVAMGRNRTKVNGGGSQKWDRHTWGGLFIISRWERLAAEQNEIVLYSWDMC